MIFIPRGGLQQGSAVISFIPFDLANASNARIELRKKTEVGPTGRFVRRPASMVAVRQFDIVPVARDFRVNINDTVTRDSITISWRARTARVDQEEIPFLIIGEVPDPAPVVTVQLPPGSTVVTHPTDIMRGRSGRGRSRKKRSR
jgi:hypothetical protein